MGKKEIEQGFIKINNNFEDIVTYLFNKGYSFLGNQKVTNKYNFKYIYFWNTGIISFGNFAYPQKYRDKYQVHELKYER